MKIAIVPWSKEMMNNQMFTVSEGTNLIQDVYTQIWQDMKVWFESHNHEMNTIDLYDDWNQIDFIILYNGMHKKWIKKLLKLHLENKLIYRAIEPVVVNSMHSNKGILQLSKIFKYIVTWNNEVCNEDRIYHVQAIPYKFKNNFGNVPFEDRKLLTNISGAKESSHVLELYSERKKVIDYFEKVGGNQFTFYGQGWNAKLYKNYGGVVENKSVIYHQYKFALCLENLISKGCITEKIFDCFIAGIVPIYYGATDILDYIPKECFIDYRKFKNTAEMIEFLKGMSKETYDNYLVAIKKFLNSDQKKIFEIYNYCQVLEKIILNDYRYPEFTASKVTKFQLYSIYFYERIKLHLKNRIYK